MDTSFAYGFGRALNEASPSLASPAHRVQRVLEVTETRWNVPQPSRPRAGAAARVRGPAPGLLARRAP